MTRAARIALLVVAGAAVFTGGMIVGGRDMLPYRLLRAAASEVRNASGLADPPRAEFYPVAEVDRLSTVPADVIMLGDSITSTGRWDEWFPDVRILNRGIGGDTVTGVRHRIPDILTHKPKAVFLLIGINDILIGRRVEEIVPVYADILGKLRGNVPQVFVQSVLACGAFCDETQRQRVTALNPELRQLAARNGATFIDLNTVIPGGATQPRYSWDGVHLTAEGYRLWCETIRQELDGLHITADGQAASRHTTMPELDGVVKPPMLG